MKNFILLLFIVLSGVATAQLNMTGPDFGTTSPLNCNNFQNESTTNFFDNGGNGNYLPNAKDTLTLCPDLNATNGARLFVTFGVNQGLTYDIHPTDTMYVFDGPDVNSPLLGAFNNGTNPNGFGTSSSYVNNPSGCLTFVFHSNGADEGTGFAANVSCGNPAQPFYPHIEAFVNGNPVNSLNPIDTGYVDICLGDTVLIVAKPLFPFAKEVTGFGYNQNLNNVNYNWEFSNGVVGANNDSITFIPTTRSGFYVGLRITDIFPQIEQTFCKIRVSQQPFFTGTGPLDSILCINEQTVILGGANQTDTVGVAFPPGSFEIGGSVAGLTPLPDGSGSNYSTSIQMSGFPVGSVFSNASDLENICMNIEHSFLGDLEIWLTCPSGVEVPLVNSYNGNIGHIPGGFAGGSVYLGGANDNGVGTPGVGAEYCFSSVNNTFGTMAAERAANNYVLAGTPAGNSMNPNGVYLPEVSFNNFNGCPLNGPWTLTVRDNWALDDGYIFEWGLYFDASLFPNNESYLNSINDYYWETDPTIISGVNDTSIVVFPNLPGSYDYTFVVEDNYGCFYDTIVNVVVKQPIVLNIPSLICEKTYTSTLSTGTNDGQWSFYNSPGTPTFTADNVNTTFTFPTPGLYHLVYSDTSCTNKDTAIIMIQQPPSFDFISDFFACPFDTEHLTFKDSLMVSSFSWGIPIPGLDTLFQADLFQGTYTASYVTLLGCTGDTTFTISSEPVTVLHEYGLICGDTLTMNLHTGTENGQWSVQSMPGTNAPVFGNPTKLNTTIKITDFGDYVLIFNNACNDPKTTTIKFRPYPEFVLFDAEICIGETHVFSVPQQAFVSSYLWNNGTSGPTVSAEIEGNYILTASNECGLYIDSAFLATFVCDLDFPNVFTPDGDGSNEVWTSLEQPDGFNSFEVKIFNRWGNVMYVYDKVSGSWDGKNSSGALASEGVYFYTVTAITKNNKEIKRQGFFHLIRK